MTYINKLSANSHRSSIPPQRVQKQATELREIFGGRVWSWDKEEKPVPLNMDDKRRKLAIEQLKAAKVALSTHLPTHAQKIDNVLDQFTYIQNTLIEASTKGDRRAITARRVLRSDYWYGLTRLRDACVEIKEI